MRRIGINESYLNAQRVTAANAHGMTLAAHHRKATGERRHEIVMTKRGTLASVTRKHQSGGRRNNRNNRVSYHHDISAILPAL